MKPASCFIIILYRPDMTVLTPLLASLSGTRVLIVANSAVPRGLPGWASVLRQRSNTGFGAAANRGMNRGFSEGFRWCTIVNQDVAVGKDAVRAYAKRLDQLQPGVAGPVAGSLDRIRYTTTPSGPVRYISGSWMSIHKEVMKKSGGFWEPYFMYYEDADLCLRAARRGQSITTVPLSGFLHNESSGIGKGSWLHEYYLARNHLLFVERQAPFAIQSRELARIPLSLIRSIRSGNRGAAAGVWDYINRKTGPHDKSLVG